jgi:hypothetical protein
MKVRAKVIGRIDIPSGQIINLTHEHICDADYSNCQLAGFGTVGCRLERCKFDNLRLQFCPQFGAGREVSEFIECTFDGARLNMGPAGFSRFVRCSFRNVYLRDWLGQSLELVDCVFSGRLHGASFFGSIPIAEHRADTGRERNEFHGNDFSGTKLVEVDFRNGIDLSRQRLPSGPEYLYVSNAAAAVSRVRNGLPELKLDSEARKTAQIIAEMFEKEVESGQRQLFLRRDDYNSYSKYLEPEAIDQIFALLRGASQ